MLAPLVAAYRDWIDREEAKLDDPAEGLAHFGDAGRVAIDNCRATLRRIEEGLQLLADDRQAFEAFGFMNRAMWLQRTHSIYSERVRRGEQPDFEQDIDLPENRSWRPFQLAFILLNLPGVTRLDHPERGAGPEALADLLLFPTGGGKTEAYLGLSAYTMALRRLQGTVAGRVGEEGVAVLMRYTLRLLTIQQFQRATALLCACESIRRKALEHGDARWGKTPFRIGLWVGRRTTPNRTDDAVEAIKQARGNQFVGGGRRHARTSSPPAPGAAAPSRRASTSTPSPTPRPGPHAHLLRRQVRPVPLQPPPGRRRGPAGRRGGRGDLPAAADAADRHGGQVRPDAVEGRGPDALRPGQRPLRAPRVPVAGDRGLRPSTPAPTWACPRPGSPNTRRSARPT